jgi:hypothetical protein
VIAFLVVRSMLDDSLLDANRWARCLSLPADIVFGAWPRRGTPRNSAPRCGVRMSAIRSTLPSALQHEDVRLAAWSRRRGRYP